MPLQHELADVAALPDIVARYRDFGVRPVWRAPDLYVLGPVHEALAGMGYDGGRPTRVQTGYSDAMCLPEPAADVVLATALHDEWCVVFLAAEFDTVDGASRVQILGWAQNAVFAGIRIDGRMVAVGTGDYSHT